MKRKSKIRGTGEIPRFSVFRSNNHIYVQAINDSENKTILASSTLNPEIKNRCKNTNNCSSAYMVGFDFGTKLLENQITKGIFDRNGKLFHGRIKSLADGIREAGIII